MIQVSFPPNHSSEKQYVIDVLFGEFMGVEWESTGKADPDFYIILLPGGASLKVRDHFFRNFSEFKEKGNLPTKVEFEDYCIFEDKGVPVIFGSSEIKISENEIILDCDLIGASFFMLSRFEEYISSDSDRHGRFPLKSSLAFKNEFHQIPVVDMYLHLLVHFLKLLSRDFVPSKDISESQMIPSHDLDHLVTWKSPKSLFGAVRRAIGQVSIPQIIYYFQSYLRKDNPFDNIQHLTDLARSKSVTPVFHLPVASMGAYDSGDFDRFPGQAQSILSLIKRTNASLGHHPGYGSYIDSDLLKVQKKKLESFYGQQIPQSRQHYLQFRIPDTLKILEENGILLDSSLGFPEQASFRCGTSREYPLFDLSTGTRLKLREQPLIFMDTSYLTYLNMTPDQVKLEIRQMQKMIKRFGGNWHFLLHNSNFFWLDQKEYFEIWEDLYDF